MARRQFSQEERKELYRQARQLWNAFDPIGVFKIDEQWPEDEYESYVGPSLRFWLEGRPVRELREYVDHVVHETIGLSRTPLGDKSIADFAERFFEWYNSRWPDTHV